jgi:hypothetical protein
MEVDTVTQDEDNEGYLTDDDYDNECSDDELPLPYTNKLSQEKSFNCIMFFLNFQHNRNIKHTLNREYVNLTSE